MSKKRTISALILSSSILIGIGITIYKGCTESVSKIHADDTVTIYLDVSNQVSKPNNSDYLYWEDADAVVKAYYAGGSDSSDANGEVMNKIYSGLYSISIPADTTSLNFFRADPYDLDNIWNSAAIRNIATISMTSDINTDSVFHLTHYSCGNGAQAGSWSSLPDIPSEDGYYLVGNETFVTSVGNTGGTWRLDTGVKMTSLSGYGDKAKIYSVYLESGSIFKIKSLLNQNIAWYSANIASNGNPEGGPTTGVEISDGNYSITTSGRFNIFLNGEGNSYISNTSTASAITIAKAFINEVGSACNANISIDALEDAWESQESIFIGLDEEVLAVLTSAKEDDTNEDLASFAHLYDYMYGKYGYNHSWNDFANRSPSVINQSNRLNILDESNNGLLILIVSLLGVSSLFASSYLIIRNKKNR